MTVSWTSPSVRSRAEYFGFVGEHAGLRNTGRACDLFPYLVADVTAALTGMPARRPTTCFDPDGRR